MSDHTRDAAQGETYARACAQLTRDRDELLAALRDLLRVDDEWHGSVNSEMAAARSKARAILAKHATGSRT